jgi:hypothetical protein
MTIAISAGMAAVFALVFLFVIASVGFMWKAAGSISLGSGLALGAFLALAAGVFLGLFKLARKWENEEPTGD